MSSSFYISISHACDCTSAQHLCTLLREIHKATTLAKSSMSLPRIWWTDCENFQTMLYEGSSLSLEQIKNMFKQLQYQVIQHWEKKILLGLDIHIPYQGDLADDLSNQAVGYCFLEDNRNPQFQNKTLFMDTILKQPQLI